MCELLLLIANNNNTDPYLDCKRLKRGDVVVVQPDGWGWSSEEQINCDWRIIKLPGIAEDLLSAFIAPELPVDPLNPGKMLQLRGFKIDVDDTLTRLPQAAKNYLLDNKRTSPSYTFNITLAQILALKLTKPPLADPNILV